MSETITATKVVNIRSIALRLQGQDYANRLFAEFDAEVPVNAPFDLIGAVHEAVRQLVSIPEATSPPLIRHLLGEDVPTFEKRWRPGGLDPVSLKLGYYKITAKEVQEDLSIDFCIESKRVFSFDRAASGNYREVCLLINELTPYCGEIAGRVNVETGVSVLNIQATNSAVAAHMRLQGRMELLLIELLLCD